MIKFGVFDSKYPGFPWKVVRCRLTRIGWVMMEDFGHFKEKTQAQKHRDRLNNGSDYKD